MPKTPFKSWTRSVVRCWAGYRADERPISFLSTDNEKAIRRILKSWREPDHLYFQVETADGRAYELRHHEHKDVWEVRDLT